MVVDDVWMAEEWSCFYTSIINQFNGTRFIKSRMASNSSGLKNSLVACLEYWRKGNGWWSTREDLKQNSNQEPVTPIPHEVSALPRNEKTIYSSTPDWIWASMKVSCPTGLPTVTQRSQYHEAVREYEAPSTRYIYRDYLAGLCRLKWWQDKWNKQIPRMGSM